MEPETSSVLGTRSTSVQRDQSVFVLITTESMAVKGASELWEH